MCVRVCAFACAQVSAAGATAYDYARWGLAKGRRAVWVTSTGAIVFFVPLVFGYLSEKGVAQQFEDMTKAQAAQPAAGPALGAAGGLPAGPLMGLPGPALGGAPNMSGTPHSLDDSTCAAALRSAHCAVWCCVYRCCDAQRWVLARR